MLELSDRPKIDGIREKYGHTASSHSFLSLFIYEESFGYETSLEDDGFFTRDRRGGFLFPCGSDDFKAKFINSHKGCKAYMMREEDVRFAKDLIPGFAAEVDEASSEYVYDRTEQTELSGHKFQRVRGKIAKFNRENESVTVPITKDNIKDAYYILSKWTPKEGEGDFSGAKKALDNFYALSLSGAITYIGGSPAGYVCGGDIGSGVLMLCSAKQICDIQGLNIVTKYEYYKTLDGVKLINTESDHGSPGIRMHKNDLRPVYLNVMYKGVL